jgi:hypothetical protein
MGFFFLINFFDIDTLCDEKNVKNPITSQHWFQLWCCIGLSITIYVFYFYFYFFNYKIKRIILGLKDVHNGNS